MPNRFIRHIRHLEWGLGLVLADGRNSIRVRFERVGDRTLPAGSSTLEVVHPMFVSAESRHRLAQAPESRRKSVGSEARRNGASGPGFVKNGDPGVLFVNIGWSVRY